MASCGFCGLAKSGIFVLILINYVSQHWTPSSESWYGWKGAAEEGAAGGERQEAKCDSHVVRSTGT